MKTLTIQDKNGHGVKAIVGDNNDIELRVSDGENERIVTSINKADKTALKAELGKLNLAKTEIDNVIEFVDNRKEESFVDLGMFKHITFEYNLGTQSKEGASILKPISGDDKTKNAEASVVAARKKLEQISTDDAVFNAMKEYIERDKKGSVRF